MQRALCPLHTFWNFSSAHTACRHTHCHSLHSPLLQILPIAIPSTTAALLTLLTLVMLSCPYQMLSHPPGLLQPTIILKIQIMKIYIIYVLLNGTRVAAYAGCTFNFSSRKGLYRNQIGLQHEEFTVITKQAVHCICYVSQTAAVIS